MIKRIYDGSMVKFELESIMTAWCKSDSGVRQGCPLSPLHICQIIRYESCTMKTRFQVFDGEQGWTN